MRILIVDEGVASTKELRRFFPKKKSKPAATRGGRHVELTVSMTDPRKAASKRSKQRQRKSEDFQALDLADQPELAAVVFDALGVALLNRGSEEGAKLIERARKIRLATVGADHPATAASNNNLARVRRERGDYAGARAALDDALRINRKVFGERSLPVAISLNELGVVQLRQFDFAAAEQTAQAGLDILEGVGLTQSDPNTTRLLDIRGRAETAQGQLKEANATFAAALALDERQLGTRNHPKYVTHLANAGLAKVAGGARAEAKNAFRKVIDVYENALGLETHPNLIDAYANLGAILRMPGATRSELEEAGECLSRAIELSTKARGPMHSLVGNDHANYARWLYATKQPNAALARFDKALRIYESNVKHGALPANHWFIAEALTWRGRVLVEHAGDARGAKDAEQTLRKAVELWSTDVYSGAIGLGIARSCLGRAIYLQRNDDPEACAELCDGYAAIAAGFPDKTFVKRLAGWIDEQGCDRSNRGGQDATAG
jgi:tetratricopeptide (TPR) repeat protein